MSSELKKQAKVDTWRMLNFLRILRYFKVLIEIMNKFKNRVQHIQNVELELRQVRFEQEVYDYKEVLKFPKRSLTPYLSHICTWLSRRYISIFCKEVTKKQNIFNRLAKTRKRILHTINRFRGHCERKKEAYQRLRMVFYEELENVSKWENKLDPGFTVHEPFVISHNMGFFREEYVNKVLNRYIDYEFVEYSKKTKCDRPVVDLTYLVLNQQVLMTMILGDTELLGQDNSKKITQILTRIRAALKKQDLGLHKLVRRSLKIENRKSVFLNVDLNKVHKEQKFTQSGDQYIPKFTRYTARALIFSLCYIELNNAYEVDNSEDEDAASENPSRFLNPSKRTSISSTKKLKISSILKPNKSVVFSERSRALLSPLNPSSIRDIAEVEDEKYQSEIPQSLSILS